MEALLWNVFRLCVNFSDSTFGARHEWMDAYREKFEKFLIDTLYFPDATPQEEPPAENGAKVVRDKNLVFVPFKSGT